MRWSDKEGQARLRGVLKDEKWNVADEIAAGLEMSEFWHSYDTTEKLVEIGKVLASLPKGYSEVGYHKSTLCRTLAKLLRSRMSVGDIYTAKMQLRDLHKPHVACDAAIAACEQILTEHRVVA